MSFELQNKSNKFLLNYKYNYNSIFKSNYQISYKSKLNSNLKLNDKILGLLVTVVSYKLLFLVSFHFVLNIHRVLNTIQHYTQFSPLRLWLRLRISCLLHSSSHSSLSLPPLSHATHSLSPITLTMQHAWIYQCLNPLYTGTTTNPHAQLMLPSRRQMQRILVGLLGPSTPPQWVCWDHKHSLLFESQMALSKPIPHR